MGERHFMLANHAIVEAAIFSGCRFFAGYPVTPATEILEHAAGRFPETGGTYIQTESEIAAINMLAGASGAGFRCMTATSSMGFSLMQETLSYMAGVAELPCVVVNQARGGPGVGPLGPSQADYFQAVKGGGHGDYRILVFGPSTVQECVDLTKLAFHLGDKYRTPSLILGDQILAQTMESFDLGEPIAEKLPAKTWAITGAKGRPPNHVGTAPPIEYDPEELAQLRAGVGGSMGFLMSEHRMTYRQRKYREIEEKECRSESLFCDDSDLVLVAYGTSARLAKPAVLRAREAGLKIGFIRPITLWPFPYKAIAEATAKTKAFLVVEMNFGQMIEDVTLAARSRVPIHFHGRAGGMAPTPDEIFDVIKRLLKE